MKIVLHHLKRTKMICTIGPATSSYEDLEKLVHIGMNAARLNFSHGTYDEFRDIIENIRKISDIHKKPISIIQDLQGPKIRVGIVPSPIQVEQDQLAYLGTGPDNTYPTIPIQFDFIPYLEEGHSIFLNDGYIKARVESVHHNGYAVIKFLNGGVISSNKGINIPDTIIDEGNLTEKDEKDLEFGLTQNIDYVALSFIHTASNIHHVKDRIRETNPEMKVIAKIETKKAIDNIDEIIEAADAIMIARGDLAIEIGMENVPVYQIEIIKKCKEHNTPVIVATQMLESMIDNPRPTRAEVNDVATAAMEEVDAVMLSGESAIGKYPFNATEMMRTIIKTTENRLIDNENKLFNYGLKDKINNAEAISYGADVIANLMGAELIAVATKSGKSATALSSLRPTKLIVAITQSKIVYNQLALVWGVRVFLVNEGIDNIDDFINTTINNLKELHYVTENSKIIFVTGLHVGIEGGTNSLRIIDI